MKTTETQEIFQGFEFSLNWIEPDIVSNDVTILYIHGQAASNQHRKAMVISQMAQELGCRFCWYELAGHANNLEKYRQTDVFVWINQLLDLLENKISGKVILIGSCIGGITGLFAGSRLQNRIKGVICLGSAYVNWREKLSAEENKKLKDNGFIYHCLAGRNIPFVLTERFVSSTEELMAIPNIITDFPVYLFIGGNDTLVNRQDAICLYEHISAPKKAIKILSKASHGMRDGATMTEVRKTLRSFLL